LPRQARLDAAGILHHAMGRGIEASKIFRTRKDRVDFLGWRNCSGRAVGAFMPNRFHLLVRAGKESLARSRRRLMTRFGTG
jgi:putative transposase